MLHCLFIFPTHQGFNSEAAEVNSIPFDSYIFTRLPNTSLLNDWTGITVSVHGDIFGALLFLPFRLFCKKAVTDGEKEHYSEDKLIYRNYTM